MQLAHLFIFLPSFRTGLAGRLLQRRRLFKAHGQSATTNVALPMQGQQQRSLQKAQAAHEVDMKGGREGIAVIARLGNGAAGLAQAGVVDGDAHQAAGTIGQGAPPHARKQASAVPSDNASGESTRSTNCAAGGPGSRGCATDSVGPRRPRRPGLGGWRDGRCAAGGNWRAQSATISDQAAKRVIGPPDVRRKYSCRCAESDRRGRPSW